MDRRSAVDESRYRIIEVVEVDDELFRQIREMSSIIQLVLLSFQEL